MVSKTNAIIEVSIIKRHYHVRVTIKSMKY